MVLLWSILFASVGVAVAGVAPVFIRKRRADHARLLSAGSIPAVGLLTFSAVTVVIVDVSSAVSASKLPFHAWAAAALAALFMGGACLVLWLGDGKRR